MRPATRVSAGIVQSGALPIASTSATRTAAISTWSTAINARRRPLTSSHAPSSGAVAMLGSVIAATVTPARAGLPVRSSTSSTTPTVNISSETRARVAALTNAW